MTTTLGKFIADRIPSKISLSEWGSGDRLDFEVTHREQNLASSKLLSWVREFFTSLGQKCEVDDDLTGTVSLEGVKYIISITNASEFKVIKCTLNRF